MAKKRRKLRSLVSQDTCAKKSNKLKFLSIVTLCLFLVGLTTAIYLNKINISSIWRDFMGTYYNQYNLLVHGEADYCRLTINTDRIFPAIRQKVINQEVAISGIELQFKNENKFLAIGIAGASGIGKTLFTHELAVNFPWQENVQQESWSKYKIEDHRLQVQRFPKYLSECGKNLIIIDNLEAADVDFIQGYNRLLYDNVLQQDSINLIVVYVFNVWTYSDELRSIYAKKLQRLHDLENVGIVEFRKFNATDVTACVQHETRNLNLTLDDGDSEEISKLIDSASSGCKNVYSKVMMYGKRTDL